MVDVVVVGDIGKGDRAPSTASKRAFRVTAPHAPPRAHLAFGTRHLFSATRPPRGDGS